MKRVRDYMSRNPVTFGPHDSLFDVAEVMAREGISGAPVVDGRKVVGIITISDMIKFMQIRISDSKLTDFLMHEPQSLSMMIAGMIKQRIDFQLEMNKLSKTVVGDFMSKDVVSINPDATILEAAELLDGKKTNGKKIDRLPVIDRRGRLVGIISRTDMLRSLLD